MAKAEQLIRASVRVPNEGRRLREQRQWLRPLLGSIRSCLETSWIEQRSLQRDSDTGKALLVLRGQQAPVHQGDRPYWPSLGEEIRQDLDLMDLEPHWRRLSVCSWAKAGSDHK